MHSLKTRIKLTFTVCSLCCLFCYQYLAQLLMTHPILSIWFHHPAEFYDSYQRLCVAFGSVFTILAVNAMFFGQGKQSVEQDLSIAIFSALITAPVGVCFPMLFTRAASTMAAQSNEANALSAINVRVIKPAVQQRSGKCMLMAAFGALWVWCAGMIFLCLVRVSRGVTAVLGQLCEYCLPLHVVLVLLYAHLRFQIVLSLRTLFVSPRRSTACNSTSDRRPSARTQSHGAGSRPCSPALPSTQYSLRRSQARVK
jgi:hypothetical protein